LRKFALQGAAEGRDFSPAEIGPPSPLRQLTDTLSPSEGGEGRGVRGLTAAGGVETPPFRVTILTPFRQLNTSFVCKTVVMKAGCKPGRGKDRLDRLGRM